VGLGILLYAYLSGSAFFGMPQQAT